MSTIVITNASTTLAVDQSHFTLRSSGRRIGRIPPVMMTRLIVHDGVEVTRKALDRLATLGVPVTFLDREGQVRCRLSPVWKLDCTPRLEQARVWFSPELRLRMAARTVDAKVANASVVLRRHAANHPNPQLSAIARDLRDLRPRIAAAATVDELMGYEGIAGRLYFSVFRNMLRVPWAEFSGRNRRPPTDPVNAVLSYCYAALNHEVHALTEARGLDPAIGYLHSIHATRPNLSLDLMEPFRPVLGDRLALRLINVGTLKPENFQSVPEQPGVRIDREGRLAILKEINDWSSCCDEALGRGLNSPGSLLLQEVESFARQAEAGHLEDFIPYYLDSDDASLSPGAERD